MSRGGAGGGGGNGGSGRVQVITRVRPPSPAEEAAGVAGAVQVVDQGHGGALVRLFGDSQRDALESVLQGCSADEAVRAASSAEPRDFAFDGALPPDAPQKEVFTAAGLPVLRDFLRGFNGTVFAYGQTGSGKTYSLLNSGQSAEEAGLLPRIVAGLFVHMAQDAQSVYEVEAAVLQVYNEQIDDLLHPNHEGGGGHNLAVHNGGIVPGLTWVKCQQPSQMIDVFTRARSNLIYAETRMNKASSRSHAVFQVKLVKRRRLTVNVQGLNGSQRLECTRAQLNVVDLAGSERVKKSGVEGVQLREATAINRSLLALGNVVSALAAKKPHVPMRDSKLTRVLDGSIGGNAKTVLLLCVSPAAEHAHETLSSLEFASRAMHVEVHAKVSTSIVELDSKALVADLRGDSGSTGAVPLGPEVRAELEELRRSSEEAAARAEAEREVRQQALAEAERKAGQLQQEADEAQQQGRSWQLQAEQLKQAEQHSRAEAAEWLRGRTAAEADATTWRATAEAHANQVQAAQAEHAQAEARADRAEALASESSRAAEDWCHRTHEAEAALRHMEADAQRRLATTTQELENERQKAAEAHCARAAEAEALVRWEADAAEQHRALEAKLADSAPHVQEETGALLQAKLELEALRSEAAESQQRLHCQLASVESATALAETKEHAGREAEEQMACALREARASLESEKSCHVIALQDAEARVACDTAAMWSSRHQALEDAHAEATSALNSEHEARFAQERDQWEARLADARGRAKAEKSQLRRQLDDQRATLENARVEAVREISDRCDVQKRRLTAAFKAARLVSQARAAELQRSCEDLASRVAGRESREEDTRTILEQRSLLQEQTREIDSLRRLLDNRDRNDRIFSVPELRRARTRSPGAASNRSQGLPSSLPPLVSRKSPPDSQAALAPPMPRRASRREDAGPPRARSAPRCRPSGPSPPMLELQETQRPALSAH